MSDQSTSNPGPWAAQIAERFTDPDIAGQVDAFLRETVQPHVTKLEQSTADLQDAQRLYEDLTSSPAETYVAITAELFGDEAADKVLSALRQGDVKEVTDDEGHTEVVAAKGAELDPDTREVIDYFREKRQAEEYDTALDTFLAENAEDQIDKALFHTFVAAAEGDLSVARQGYLAWAAKWQERYGEMPTVTEDDVPNPPVTLGSAATQGGTTPPIQKKYASIDDALDDFFAEQKAAPTVIGSV